MKRAMVSLSIALTCLTVFFVHRVQVDATNQRDKLRIQQEQKERRELWDDLQQLIRDLRPILV